MKTKNISLILSLSFLVCQAVLWAFAGGSLSGILKDPSGAVVPGANLTLTNTALKAEFKATSDAQGFYSFPTLAVGQYDLTIEAPGFQPQKRTGITIDADSAVRVDAALVMAQQEQEVTVSEAGTAVSTQVETTETQLGEVVASANPPAGLWSMASTCRST